MIFLFCFCFLSIQGCVMQKSIYLLIQTRRLWGQGWRMNESVLVSDSLSLSVSILFLPLQPLTSLSSVLYNLLTVIHSKDTLKFLDLMLIIMGRGKWYHFSQNYLSPRRFPQSKTESIFIFPILEESPGFGLKANRRHHKKKVHVQLHLPTPPPPQHE